MKTSFLFTICISTLLCCKKDETVKPKNDNGLVSDSINTEQVNNIDIQDSLFIGEPLAGDQEFIQNMEEGGNGYIYLDKFDLILKKHNRVFSKFRSNEIIKSIPITSDVSLELKRRKFSKKENLNNIQIMMYTRYKGRVKDSIVFYKFEVQKDVGGYGVHQRLETISFLKNDLTLYHLDSYTGLYEMAFQPRTWNKYKINITTGKIDLIKKLDYADNEEDKVTEEPKKEEYKSKEKTVVEEDIEGLPFENVAYLFNCNKSDYVSFGPMMKGSFSCPSTELRFDGLLKKIKENEYELRYEEIRGYNIEPSLDSKNYSKETAIAIIKYSNSIIQFKWIGFYNLKTKKIEFTKNPFTNKVELAPIILKKCKSNY